MTVLPNEPPAFLRLGTLSDDEERTRNRLISQLSKARYANFRQEAFYEGFRKPRDLGISIPPHLRDVEAVASGPEIVVDVLDERMDWRGWRSPGVDLGLEAVYRENHLEIEIGQTTLDALICGIGFLSGGTGDAGEPDVLVKAESPNRMTATWDGRLRRATEALREDVGNDGRLTGWTLYELNQTIRASREGGRVVVVDRDEHDLDRVPVAVLLNRPRSSRMTGRSEITRAIRSTTESTMRTLLGMEIAREFYGAPQRWMMGADESMFVDESGNLKSQWEAMIGRMLLAPRDENDELPVVGQFSQSSPQPFTEIVKTYFQLISASSGIPVTHFGFATDNPASSDAIDRADKRINTRTKRRIGQFDLGLLELANIVTLWRTAELPPAGSVRSLWVDPAKLSPNAAADRASKMIAAGSLDPSWDFTLEQFGLDDDEIERVRQERLRVAGRTAMGRLAAAAEAARADAQVTGLADGSASVV